MAHDTEKTDLSLSDDSELLNYCPDLNEWPAGWSHGPEDLPRGDAILKIFKPFLLYLVRQGVGKMTTRKHFDNTCLLGDELISRIHHDEKLCTRTTRDIVLSSVDEEGGPMSRRIDSETAQASFHSTCRMLYRYLTTMTTKKQRR